MLGSTDDGAPWRLLHSTSKGQLFAQKAEANGDVSGASRKRMKQKLLPKKVLWRFSNQNMPRAWDLEAESHHACSGGAVTASDSPAEAQVPARPVVREGLAVISECAEWWQKLVRRTARCRTLSIHLSFRTNRDALHV